MIGKLKLSVLFLDLVYDKISIILNSIGTNEIGLGGAYQKNGGQDGN